MLAAFRGWHTPRRSHGQYRSLMFYTDATQRDAIAAALRDLDGDVTPEVLDATTPEGRFWDAEAYHQKYRLRRNTALVTHLEATFGPRWDEHTVATKLNAASARDFDVTPWLGQLSPPAQRAYRLG